MGRYPVTNRQYAEFLKRVKTQEEPQRAGWFLRKPAEAKLDHPVVGIGWEDACAYCAWLSQETRCTYRLPSEAEWEKAARGEDGRRFPWGNEWANRHANAGRSDTTPVDAYPTGTSPYGCVDMAGNVQEWTRTLWGSQAQTPDYAYPYTASDGREIDDPEQLPPVARMIHRGGSFKSPPDDLRTTARGHSDVTSKVTWRGFRVARQP
jgi:formylglycine-generating enzyme required for sulfatase activity